MIVQAGPHMTDKKIIMLVDDTPANIQVVNAILKDVYKTRIASNGPKAIELAKTAPQPDLILLDVTMPGMDGYEVCSQLKADPATRDIPVIFLTAKTEAEDETRGFEVGAVDYIHKPFSPPVVQARVQTHLLLRDAREQLTAEKRRLDLLLDNILPAAAVVEIKETGGVNPRRFENVAVLFSDLVSFTSYCDQHSAEEVVKDLEALFVIFERCARDFGLEKIKTIGDAFMATAGLLAPHADPLRGAVSCALAIHREIAAMGKDWSVRSGVHVGPVMAGIVGSERYQFDLWGDTVNVASRLTGAAAPGCVGLLEDIGHGLEGAVIHSRGEVTLKGKGSVRIVEISALA